MSKENYALLDGVRYLQREKEGYLTRSYDKNPYINRKFEINGQHKNATKNFDYTTIEDRLRTVSWSNNCATATNLQLI